METINDIVREMRNLGRLDEKSTDKIPRRLQALGLRTYADRLEAAMKHEVGVAKMETTTLPDIVRKVAEEMMNTSMQQIYAETICGWANRLCDAVDATAKAKGEAATCKESLQVGNAAKMREALETISKCDINKEEDCYTLYRVCESALSAPPRNCDVGTAEEQEGK